jgi:STE24 endopeptidase
VIEIPASSAAAIAYQAVSDRFWLIDQLAAPVLALLLLASGSGARLCNAIARRVGGRRPLVVALYAASFAILLQLVRMPLDYFWVRSHDRAMRAAPTPFVDWLPGQVRDAILLLLGFVAVALALYALLARRPRAWWVVAAIAGSLLTLLALVGQPLTRSYEPLGSPANHRDIAAIAARAGVPYDRIGIQRSGDLTGCGAATVIGLGPTRLMLLDDTLVGNYPPAEVVQSVAHESSHYTRDDNVKAFVMISAWLAATLALVHFAGGWAASRWHRAFGFVELADPASLPLGVLIIIAAYLAALPFGRAYQRTMVEQRADRFALDLTHDNTAEAMLYVKDMNCYPLMVSTPSRFHRLFRATHPSIAERIRFANRYHPWQSPSK